MTSTGSVTFHGPVSAGELDGGGQAHLGDRQRHRHVDHHRHPAGRLGHPGLGPGGHLGQGAGHSTITAVSGTTNAAGVATFSVTDPTPRSSPTRRPTPASPTWSLDRDGPGHLPRPGLGRPPRRCGQRPPRCTDNGTSTSTITVTLLDASGTPVSGQTVTPRPGAGARVHLGRRPPPPTGRGRHLHGHRHPPTGRSPTRPPTPADRPGQLTQNGQGHLRAVTAAVSQTNSRCGQSRLRSPTTGSASTVTVTLEDVSGTPIPGQTVTLSQNRAATPPSPPSRGDQHRRAWPPSA